MITVRCKVRGLAGLGMHPRRHALYFPAVTQLPEVPNCQAVVAAAAHKILLLSGCKLHASLNLSLCSFIPGLPYLLWLSYVSREFRFPLLVLFALVSVTVSSKSEAFVVMSLIVFKTPYYPYGHEMMVSSRAGC